MSFDQSIFRKSVFFLVLIPLFAVWGFWVTYFTLLDPIFARIIAVNFYPVPFETGVIQWMTFAFIDVIVIALVIKDWRSSGRRDVFFPALVLLAVAQIAMLTVWDSAPWKAFASWFAGLPLT